MPLRLVLQAGVRGVASASRATRHASACLAPLPALAGPAVHPPNHRLGRRYAASAAQAAPTPAPGWHPETSVKHEDEPDARWTPTGTGGYPADWAAINESEWAPGKMVSFILCSDSKLKVHVLGTLGTALPLTVTLVLIAATRAWVILLSVGDFDCEPRSVGVSRLSPSTDTCQP